MRRMRLAVLTLLIAVCCTFASAAHAATPEEEVLARYIEAFNRHDIPALVTCVDTAFSWYTVVGDSTKLAMQGRAAQRSGLVSYFKGLPDVRSELEGVMANGPWVMARERVRWTSTKSGPQERAAISVYEIRDGLIKRVWYFPAEKPTKP